jgi:hypothetical protein
MPEVSYSYDIRVGPYQWIGQAGDVADYGPTDGLEIIRAEPDTELRPAPEDIVECKFQLIAASSADLVQLEEQLPVHVLYDSPADLTITNPLESFHGRVAEVTSQPHELGIIYTVSCLDYRADLREIEVGGSVNYPQETIKQRVDRIMAEAGLTLTWGPFSGTQLEAPTVAARTASTAKLLDLVEWYLSQWPEYHQLISGITVGPYRMILGPSIVGNELAGWKVTRTPADTSYIGPLQLQDVGGLWSAVAAVGGAPIVDGGEVDFASTYAVTKRGNPTRVTVSGDKAGALVVNADLGVDPPVTATMESVEVIAGGEYASAAAVYAAIADMYLPADVTLTKWVADAFLWHVEFAPAGASLPELGSLMAVAPVEADKNPGVRAWHVGILSSYTFTVANKRPVYVFTLRRPAVGTDEGSLMTWDQVPAAATWDTLNPELTWDDLRLVRGF